MTKKKALDKEPVPLLEWVAAAFGLLVALALIGIVARGAVVGSKDEVPLLAATVERVLVTPAGHVVEVAVVNRSSVTAASVQIEGVSGTNAETSGGSIDYVPGNSRVVAGLLFKGDPRANGIEVRVTGYELP